MIVFVQEKLINGCHVVVRYSECTFKKLYQHRRCVVMKGIKGNVKEVSFITEWMHDHNIRKYSDFGIYPDPEGLRSSDNKCPDGVYNLSGVSVEYRPRKRRKSSGYCHTK